MPDPEKDELRLFGCYSYKTKKYYVFSNVDDMIKVIKAHKYLVGFNNKNYDNPILKRHDINLDYKIFLDLFEIIKKRSGIIKTDNDDILKDILMSYSLDNITRVLGLVTEDEAKMKLDYTLLNKPMWTPDEARHIKAYTERDIDITKRLYEFLENYFDAFKDFLTNKDIEKKCYLTSSVAVYGYKTICKEMGWQEEYEDGERESDEEKILGGYVSYPAGEFFSGNIVCFDFASLYPNLFIQCNLFSNRCDCCKDDEKWNGGGFFQVQGKYCIKQQGKIERVLKKYFLLRKEFKKNKDGRELSIKITINAFYGMTDNPSFKLLYNKIAASDCTSLGRQCIKYVRKRFREEGFINIATDTDSIFIYIPEGKTLGDAKRLADDCAKELQSHMTFPW
jgi:DNA polymerase elongation subunit (family B)